MQIVVIRSDGGEQLRHGFDDHRAVPGGIERGLEAIAHVGSLGDDGDGFTSR